MKKLKLFAKTFAGLEQILAQEISELGGTDVRPGVRGVACTGDMSLVYAANYASRTALRILVELHTCTVFNEDTLYHECKKIPWEDIMDVTQSFSMDATVNSRYFNHSHYVALKVKDALVDRFRERIFKRPSVAKSQPDVKINVHIEHKQLTISLDASSDSLHQRGYRIVQGEAPLNEVLAAGMILLSGWDKKTPFLDPMCGSGTIPIEAALIASNTPSGYYRSEWGFMKWKDYDKNLFQQVKEKINAAITTTPNVSIIGYDKSFAMTRASQQNLLASLMDNWVQIEKKDFFKIEQIQPPYHIVTNPPYGQRLNEDDIPGFYKETGRVLKHFFAGSTAWIITSNEEAMKYVGLKTSAKISLFNGALPCKFYRIDLYQGSKKEK
ncbi:MAG: THUMP domain-containing protein [Flavobacteriales bacterium]|nr:THUMP domain-containing protein [Flavobacteriales bacterium]